MPAGERPDRSALERMTAALHHRGPDDRGIVVHENAALASTRLAIVDPGPAGHQPLWDASSRWLVAFNGEVYNHLALRDALPASDWRGHSDTETLAAALAAWGDGAVERCNGPLALAALDRERGRLVLARDRFGKKPLYVARHRGGIWFASEMRTLLAAGVPARPRTDVLAHYAVRGWACGPQTPLAGVDRLDPGSLMTVDLASLAVTERRWYEPTASVDPELARELATLPRERIADRLEVALREAVRSRLMADVPIGTMCSGGLDSALITALTLEEHGPVTAFNCSLPDDPRADEARWARRVADALDVELESVSLRAEEWRAALVEAVRVHEYPLAGPAPVPIGVIAARARSRGVPVLLTGEGADELFAGYPLAHGRTELRYLPWHVIARRYGGAVVRRRLPVRPLIRAAAGRRAEPPIDPAARSLAEREAVRERATRAYAHHRGPRSQLEAALLGGLTCSNFPFLLNRMDKGAMSASVETRLPFLDPGVVELALNLPLELRTQPRLKGVLRDVARRHLPTSLAHRPKQPGMHFDARRRIEDVARPAFLANGLLRDLLGATAGSWRALRVALLPRQVVSLWTAEIWARLMLESQSVERIERELWTA
jgi:asparagine synthase (glutamine-hydrolysing)